jgi:hypothetical protein
MISPHIIQSSPNSLILQSMFLQISFIYTINISGTKTLPCGTPKVTLTSLDSCPPSPTLCVRPTRNSLTQKTTLQSTPKAASSIGSQSWGSKSKAFDKSIIIAFKPTTSCKESAKCCHTVMTWLAQDYPGLNSCCPSYNQSFWSQTGLKYLTVTCSSCLQNTKVELLGLQLVTAVWSALCQ